MPRSRPYKVGLNKRLKDPAYAAAYLNAAKEESQAVLLLALRDVVQTHRTSKVALDAGVNRETLYRTLSRRGNPTMATLERILNVLGMELEYRPRRRRERITRAGYVAPLQTSAQNAGPSTREAAFCDLSQGQESSSALFGVTWRNAAFIGGSSAFNCEVLPNGIANSGDVGFEVPAFMAATSNRSNCDICLQP